MQQVLMDSTKFGMSITHRECLEWHMDPIYDLILILEKDILSKFLPSMHKSLLENLI